MTSTERRRYPRHETEIAVTIYKDNEETPAIMTNISQGGIGLISARGFFPGTEVDIALNYIDDYSIHGTVRWGQQLSKNGSTQYRNGIEADQILIDSENDKTESPIHSEFVKRLLSNAEK